MINNKRDSVYIIAEAGVNHNGDIGLAYKLIDVGKESGANAVKFQTFIADQLVSSTAQRATYQKKNMPDVQETQLEMIKKLELKINDFIQLKEYCNKIHIDFMTTPLDFNSADLVYDLVDIYKLSSGEVTNTPFLEHVAKKGKPIILSTGMANLGEVEKAIDTISHSQSDFFSTFPKLSLLHCTSNYPCPYDEVNLKAMITMKEAFKLNVGYSDHTLGIEVPIAAVALGATIIEKHFTLDRNMKGPDHKASLEPKELKEMVQSIRNIEKSMGNGIKKPNDSEIEIMKVARKSIVAARNISKGEIFTEKNIEIKRPGTGISPEQYNFIIGKKANIDFKKDELIVL
jgi:N,N'-diacetyllegionaminate synthase